jgi:hypothetical protein
LLAAIELGLDLKFGAEGLQLMPEIKEITDLDVLRAVRDAIKPSRTLDEVRRVWSSKRRPKKGRRT